MTDLVTTDEVFLDNIAGLLSFDGSVTPRLVTPKPVEDTGGLGALLFTQDLNNAGPSSTSNVGRGQSDKRSSKREKEKNRQRRYRQRLKDSREELQRQVDALSEQLNGLRQESAKKKKTGPTDMILPSSRLIAEVGIQRENRLQSEAEQQRLLATVNYQAKYIKGLRQAVNNKLSASGLSCDRKSPVLHSMTSGLYTTYLQLLEGCYARVNNVMDECAFALLPETTINSTQRSKTDGGVAYFQHINKAILPYSFQQTYRALRNVVHEQDESAFGGNEIAPDNDVTIKTRVLKARNTGVLAQRFVSRQYVDEERMVLVWIISSEGDEGFHGLHAEEKGWMSVEPSASGVVLSVCVQQAPKCFSSGHCREPAIGKFYNMLHESLETDKREMAETMGKLLLDEVLSGIEC
uniref:BZIP domain-containing protein n=1 Tax=Phytophthora ramorum TaxID=164328 RepID=H3H620_PHYRM